MNAPIRSKPPHILLIEPDNLVRGTLAAVCRDLDLARVHQATNVAAANAWLDHGDLEGMVVALDLDGAAMNLLAEIRAGKFACSAHLAVAVMSSVCTVELIKDLKALDVRRILLQPFKLRDAILMLEQLGAPLAPEAPSNPSVKSIAASDADKDAHSEDRDVRKNAKTGSESEAHPS
ncbi:hypothetical protein [Hydrogenophaga sp. PAMC20947]|uniref:hypothetical protein n=1 Tax=Hydrogenophaga sp. PAMC20947 TaxID=2565558 RepID=UPI00109DD4F9|nr:hypothetical protein [Hydrogenophaga sp. PAMC20947]QCB47297.1 hypothetical protein E5678_15445 [Hydrogenophaga sp. PAMC20947]